MGVAGMIGLETAATAAGKAVAEKAAREWLAARVLLEGREKNLSELMVISFPDRFVRRKIDRQLAGIADSVEKRIYDLISNEYRQLSSNDRSAVVLEVASALREAVFPTRLSLPPTPTRRSSPDGYAPSGRESLVISAKQDRICMMFCSTSVAIA